MTTDHDNLLTPESIADVCFEVGELYLFHPSDPTCPADESLWGMGVSWTGCKLLFESASRDLTHFHYWQQEPLTILYYRKSDRGELRDYCYNMARFDASDGCCHRPCRDEDRAIKY